MKKSGNQKRSASHISHQRAGSTAFAAELGELWKPIARYASDQIPCRCVGQRSIVDSVEAAIAQVEPGVWMVACAKCRRRWSVSYHGQRCSSLFGGFITGELTWWAHAA